MSIIFGIDPGSRKTGYGVIEVRDGASGGEFKALDFGVIALDAGWPLARRLARLNLELTEKMRRWQPHFVAVEKVFLGKNPDSAFVLGHARGVCLQVAGSLEAHVVEYATRSVKKSVTGQGGADKEQVQLVIQALLGVRVPHLDATDALALAVCHGRQVQVDAVMKKGLSL